MSSSRASPLLRSHLFFEDDMVFHSPPRVRLTGTLEYREFQKKFLQFLASQNKINSAFADPVLYYITSAYLNIDFCEFIQNHASMIRNIPEVLDAVLFTLEYMGNMFTTHKIHMPNKLAQQLFSTIKATQELLQ